MSLPWVIGNSCLVHAVALGEVALGKGIKRTFAIILFPQRDTIVVLFTDHRVLKQTPAALSWSLAVPRTSLCLNRKPIFALIPFV